MAGAEYWIWLQKALGPKSVLACKLVEYFGSAENVYLAGRSGWLDSGLMTPAKCDKLCTCSPSESFDVMYKCLEHDLDILTPEHRYYPKQLLKIKDYPLVLYAKGRTSVLSAPVLAAVVGTRKSSAGGERFTREFCAQLVQDSVVVVSGGALGIDTAAHEGTLRAGGLTVAVMGCGLGHDYLMQNEPLRRRIAANGVIISEYLPETPPSRSSFPTRNRILAGMSQATVVIEAAEKSGSFITAGDALHMKRMVFAVPSSVTESFYSGTDKLIREKKAYSLASGQDILHMLHLQNEEWTDAYEAAANPELPGRLIPYYRREEEAKEETERTAQPLQRTKEPKTEKKKPAVRTAAETVVIPPAAEREKPEWLTGDLETVVQALQDGQKSPDELIRVTGLSSGKLMVAISKLEIKNVIERDFGIVRLK